MTDDTKPVDSEGSESGPAEEIAPESVPVEPTEPSPAIEAGPAPEEPVTGTAAIEPASVPGFPNGVVPSGPPVAAATTVVLAVSKGAQRTPMGCVTMPDVLGEAQNHAIEAIQAEGLNVAIVSDPSPLRSGKVWGQVPAPGLPASPGSKAVVVVSSGKVAEGTARTVLPNVVGKPAEEAQDVIRSVGLNPYVVEDYNSAVPAGYVYAQQPDARSLSIESESRAWIGVLIVLGLIGLLLVGLLVFKQFQGEPAAIAVPSVVGSTTAEAESQLEGVGLTLGSVTETMTDSAAEGTIVSQDPAAGQTVDAGTRVNLVVASTTPGVAVPNVVGQNEAQAKSGIEAAGLVATPVSVYSSSVAAGLVVSQAPQPGVRVQSGTEVSIQVSKGPQPAANVKVPNVVGQPKDAATGALQGAGLVAQTYENYSSTVAAGIVIAQSPPANSSVANGTAIALSISKGPAPATVTTVQVPNVVTMTQSEAQKALTDVGLMAKIVESPSNDAPAGNVFAQAPLAGETVAKGTTVFIAVSTGPAPQP